MTPRDFVTVKHLPHDVYVGRPSVYGNPFSDNILTKPPWRTSSRVESIQKFRDRVLGTPSLLILALSLRGKKLACWCFPRRCHAEVWAAIANDLPMPSFESEHEI